MYRINKYKEKLRTIFISSYLVPLKEFGPTHLPFQEESMIPFHLLKSMVMTNMKWRTFYIQGFVIVNSNIWFIGMGMM